MDGTLANLAHGFSVALQPHNLLFSVLGVLSGNVIGVLPGMGIMATISILLPLTFGMPPVAAVLMLSSIYSGALFGAAIPPPLFHTPGQPCPAATTLVGSPLPPPGRARAPPPAAFPASFIRALSRLAPIPSPAPPHAHFPPPPS